MSAPRLRDTPVHENDRIPHLYENRWMTVPGRRDERADDSSGIYGVVEKTDFALVIPFPFDGDGFYLVEQYLGSDVTQGTPAPAIEEADLRVERVTLSEFE